MPLAQILASSQIYDMEPASAWDVLALTLPALAPRLRVLHITNCFWHSSEPFATLAGLSNLVELRLRNVPLETAAEVEVGGAVDWVLCVWMVCSHLLHWRN